MGTAPKTMAVPAIKSRSHGFTLFELILVIIVVALAAGMLAGRVLTYQEAAEKAAMEQTAGAVRSALTIQATGLIVRGGMENVQKLVTVNPITLLTEHPKNYAGEFYVLPDDIPPGNWYFDLKARQLVYLVRHDAHFQSGEEGVKAVRYQVTLMYNDLLSNANGKSDRKEIGGVALREVLPYKWDIK